MIESQKLASMVHPNSTKIDYAGEAERVSAVVLRVPNDFRISDSCISGSLNLQWCSIESR